MKNKQIIAILAGTAGLTGALSAAVLKRNPDAEIVPIKKLNERPAGAIVASLGLPSFVPGQDGVKILSYGSRILDNATPAERSHQWSVLRDPKATTEEVLAELGAVEEYVITKAKAAAEIKSAIVDIKLSLSEAITDEEKMELYKQGFNLLQSFLA